MLITFFINTLSSGGAEHQLSILANLLSERGHSITIVTYGDLPDHYSLSSEIQRVRIAENKSTLLKLVGIFKYFFRSKEEVIISFCQQNNLICGLCLKLLSRKKRLIVGERNCSISTPSKIENFLFRYIYPTTEFIVTNSYSQADFIKQHAPSLANKVKTIINYTDTNYYRNKKINLTEFSNEEKVIRFCVVARYDKQKNYNRFALALKKLRDKGYCFRVDWFGAKFNNGQVPRTEYIEFDRLRKEFNLEEFLSLNDSVRNIDELLPRYDFFCLPSLFEGFSNAISEAICCGLPAVVSDVSDNHIMVKNGINGFLFKADDPNDIAAALEKVLNLNKTEREQMGKKSREIALDLFSRDKFLQSYLSVINS